MTVIWFKVSSNSIAVQPDKLNPKQTLKTEYLCGSIPNQRTVSGHPVLSHMTSLHIKKLTSNSGPRPREYLCLDLGITLFSDYDSPSSTFRRNQWWYQSTCWEFWKIFRRYLSTCTNLVLTLQVECCKDKHREIRWSF